MTGVMYCFSPVTGLSKNSVARFSSVISYLDLEKALDNNQWSQASTETEAILIQLTNINVLQGDTLHKSFIEKLSCQHLYRIDSLWSEASQNKFGIRTQIEIWKSVGGTAKNYADAEVVDKYRKKVGWDQPEMAGANSNDIDTIYLGYFPANIITQGVITTPFFMERLEECDKHYRN